MLEICPYLHERKLYLDYSERNSNYFTTSLECNEDVLEYNEKINSFLHDKKLFRAADVFDTDRTFAL